MIELFVLDTCPYSQKVMRYMRENNIDYEKKDIIFPENLKKLLDLGGMQQVPFMYIPEEDIKMYESDDIISYFKKHQNK